MRKLIRDAVIYFALALGCIIGADYVANPIWHDALLVIGGVCLGGVAVMVTLVDIQLKAGKDESAIRIGDETIPRK